MTDPRIVPCEHCGTEGRIYERADFYDRQYGWQPGERDLGPCEACEGTGGEIVETEPITLEDLTMSEAHWFEAYRACPCGCGYDGDFLIDDDKGYAIAWRCNVTGESGGCEPPPDYDAA